jgi:hypothetical protein
MESALDDEPAVSDFKEDANRTDSITYDDVDECVEQTRNDNQSSLSAPLAVSDNLEAVTLDLGEHTADEPLPCFYSADH